MDRHLRQLKNIHITLDGQLKLILPPIIIGRLEKWYMRGIMLNNIPTYIKCTFRQRFGPLRTTTFSERIRAII